MFEWMDMATDTLFIPLADIEPPEPAPPLPPLEAPQPVGLQRLTTEQEGRLIAQVRAHYEEATQDRDERIRRRELRYRRYLADPTLRAGMQPWDDAPQLFLPLTRKTIEVLKDEFVEALGSLDALRVKGVGKEDVSQADVRTYFLRYALEEINPLHWDELKDQVIHDALQDSLGIVKVYPYQHPFPQETVDGQLLKTIVRMDRVDEGTMLLPPNATGLQWPECAYLGQQLWVTVDEFPSMQERGFSLPDIEAVEAGAGMLGRQYTDDERKLLEFTRMGMDPELARHEFDPRIEMVEAYELFAMERGAPREFVVVHWFPHLCHRDAAVGNGQLARVLPLQQVLKQNIFPRPMWPFFDLTVWAQPGQLYGLNVPDRLETPQDLLNRLAEQMIEQGEIDILPFVFANVALTGDLPNLRRIKPGEIVPLDSMGSVTFSPRQSNTRHFLEQMTVPQMWAEQDSGVTALVQGRSAEFTQSRAHETLGGLSLQLAQSNKGFKKQTHHLARQLKRVLKMYMGLWQGHVGSSMSIPMPDLEGLQQRLFEGGESGVMRQRSVSPKTLSGMFDIAIQVNPEAHLEQQKRFVLAEKLDGLLAPIWPLGRRELWKSLWEALGLQEFERFYPEPVAVIQTMLLTLQAQLQLATLEGALMQAGQPPAQGGPFQGLFAGGGERPVPQRASPALASVASASPMAALGMGG